jgi:alpha-L-fucosidase
MKVSLFIAAFALLLTVGSAQAERQHFEPNWESLNARQSPEWFRDAKFGIFIHWGVYSVPSICHTSTYSEWYYWWYERNTHGGLVRKFHDKWYGKDFKYQDFAPQFRAELWEPADWARLFKRAGAKYVVLVSKHHDGFALWPNKHASEVRGYDWNSVDAGPHRDIVGEMGEAVRAEGLRMGYYFSFMEWANPLYKKDPKKYVETMMIPQIKELVTRYKPAVFWPDGEWNYPHSHWKSTEILSWMYNNCENPEELVVNDRWGKGLRGQSGDYYTTEYGSLGGGAKGMADENRPFEECRGIGHSFAFNRLENYDIYQTRDSLVQMLIDLVSKGGGMLLNIGPTADGRVPVIQQDRLIALGEWLSVNGDAIYGTRKSNFRYIPWGRSTTKDNTIYLHVFDWPGDHTLELDGLMTRVKKAYLLHDSNRTPLKLAGNGSGRLSIDLLGYHPFSHASVIALELDGEPKVENRIIPSKDGVLSLSAERAELKGGIKLETTVVSSGEATVGISREKTLYNAGYWLKKEGRISWDALLRPGQTYSVEMEYACKPGSEGGAFTLEVGDQRLEGKVKADTGSWQEYKIMNLGVIKAGSDKREAVTMKALMIPGEALMNVRKVVLTPVEGS